MNDRYTIQDTSEIITPALIVFRELVEANIDQMIAIAGRVQRLRPHCKTHKIREVTELELQKGITKHKCATLAEAEMLAAAGVKDIFLAYNPVGPNIGRVVKLQQAYPQIRLAVTVDHPTPLAALGAAVSRAGRHVDVLLDVETGLQRSGVAMNAAAVALYQQIAATAGVRAAGLHVYDGHIHDRDLDDRRQAVQQLWKQVAAFRDRLQASGLPVPTIVAGGTGTFPIYATMDEPALEMSPGTPVFYDAGYAAAFPDLPFHMAAVLLTRVVSRPGTDLITCDLGTKACASDPPPDSRLVFPDLPEAKLVLQNEEHLVLQTPRAAEFQPGDELLAVPWHICPTTALHRAVFVVADGRVVDRWAVTARDRWLTI
jgi:D-serine deaminase-like pyridoxal phosphate-dependent protein